MSNNLSFRDKLIPWYIVTFFVVIAIVDGIFVTIAMRTHTGVVAKHPYEKGIAYNQTIKDAEDQEELGWKSNFEYKNISRQFGKISFSLRDANGKKLEPEKIYVTITRPVQEGMDFRINLTKENAGIFQSNVFFPEEGLWELRAYAEVSGQKYQQSKRVNVE